MKTHEEYSGQIHKRVDRLMKDLFDLYGRDAALHLMKQVSEQENRVPALCAKLVESEAKVKELEAKLVEAAKPCEWTEDEDEGIWTATCGLVDWCFNEGGPIENKVHHCVGCGHPVVVKKGAEHGE